MECSVAARLFMKTNIHVTQFEGVDTMLFKSVFQTPRSTSIAAYSLETGAIPIRFILKGGRLMNLWTILQKDDEDLVSKVSKHKNYFQ